MTTRLLMVDAPHFVAGAIWEGDGSAARCTKAAPILAWMRGKTPLQVKRVLLAKKYSWAWIDSTPNDQAQRTSAAQRWRVRLSYLLGIFG